MLNVQVNRVLPDTLDLAITERTIAAVVTVTGSDKQTENWAIASDGMWLMKIPDQNSDEGKSISQQVYTDADRVLHITDVPYGVKPQEGAYCSDLQRAQRAQHRFGLDHQPGRRGDHRFGYRYREYDSDLGQRCTDCFRYRR